MIFPGKLDQVIEIQSVTSTEDGTGSVTESWTAVSGSPKRAEYIPIRGVERMEAGKLGMVTMFKLRIRRYADLDTSHRITHGGKTYRITGVEDYQREGDMVLHCAEVL